MPGKRGRGHHQRAAARANENDRPSQLAEWLLEQYCFGLISAIRVQVIAQCAVSDHEGSPDLLEQLAAIGTYGKWPSNCDDSLRRLLSRTHSTLPAQTTAPIPMKGSKVRAGTRVDVGCVHAFMSPSLALLALPSCAQGVLLPIPRTR